MSIPSRLSRYLDQRGAHYEICTHDASHSSAETARNAHVRPSELVKSVLLEDEAGCLVAVVPADRAVMLGKLAHMLGRNGLRLSDEDRIAMLFDDCERGALPPIGMAWGLETIVDDELESNEIVYMEGGDHEHLLRMSGEEFHELMNPALHGHFCKRMTH